MRTYGGCSSTIPDLDTRGRWVVSFMPQLPYSLGKSLPHPLGTSVVGYQSQSGRYGVETKYLDVVEIEPRSTSPQPIDILVVPCWLPNNILYRDGGTCWGNRTQPLSFTGFYSRLNRRYYNRSVTNSFHTQAVLTIALSRATPIPVLSRTLGAFDCRLISSARRLATDWRLQALFLRFQPSLQHSKLSNSSTVGPKIALRV
jgi:hypothetical protein